MTAPNQPSRRQRPLQPVPDAEEASFGTWLRQHRELREISLREIADVTKIGIRYLEALELDRFEVLPAPVFARGFLREYARYVGLDPDEVVNSYIAAQRAAEPEEEQDGLYSSSGSRFEKTSALFLSIAVVLVLVVVAAVAFYIERRSAETGPDRPPMAAPSNDASKSTEASRERVHTAPEDPLAVVVEFSGTCWIEAVIDDKRRISELHADGESIQLDAKTGVVLTLDNPQSVQIFVNGKAFPFDVDSTAIPTVIDINSAVIPGLGQ